MIVVSGRFRLPLERIADARPYMAKVIAASSAEPGCRVYSYAEAIDEPGLFRVYEEWDGQASVASAPSASEASGIPASSVNATRPNACVRAGRRIMRSKHLIQCTKQWFECNKDRVRCGVRNICGDRRTQANCNPVAGSREA